MEKKTKEYRCEGTAALESLDDCILEDDAFSTLPPKPIVPLPCRVEASESKRRARLGNIEYVRGMLNRIRVFIEDMEVVGDLRNGSLEGSPFNVFSRLQTVSLGVILIAVASLTLVFG